MSPLSRVVQSLRALFGESVGKEVSSPSDDNDNLEYIPTEFDKWLAKCAENGGHRNFRDFVTGEDSSDRTGEPWTSGTTSITRRLSTRISL